MPACAQGAKSEKVGHLGHLGQIRGLEPSYLTTYADVRLVKGGTARALAKLRACRADDDHAAVFGLSASAIYRRVQALAKHAGIDGRTTPHSARIGLASELTMRGASIQEVMRAGELDHRAHGGPLFRQRHRRARRGGQVPVGTWAGATGKTLIRPMPQHGQRETALRRSRASVDDQTHVRRARRRRHRRRV